MHNSGQAGSVILVSTAAVAARLGVTSTTVSRMVKAGRLKPAFQAEGVRGPRYFHPADVDALVEQERRELEARLGRMNASVPA